MNSRLAALKILAFTLATTLGSVARTGFRPGWEREQ